MVAHSPLFLSLAHWVQVPSEDGLGGESTS